MKNCDEMVNSLLERRDRYVAAQKRKRKIITRTLSAMCCVCLVTILGVGMWQIGMFSTNTPEQTLKNTVSPRAKDNFDGSKVQSKVESHDASTTNNKIIINSIKDISTSKLNISLLPEDYVEMTGEKMIEYYGVDYIPDVPSDIKLRKGKKTGIYRRNSGNGEVYWDANFLNYSNEDDTRTVHIEFDKGSHVLRDYEFSNSTEKKSVINNVEIMIGLTENGSYYAEFMYNKVGFFLNAEGVTEEEFVSIISSIVK